MVQVEISKIIPELYPQWLWLSSRVQFASRRIRSGIKELNLLAALELHFGAYIEPFHHQFHGCRELV